MRPNIPNRTNQDLAIKIVMCIISVLLLSWMCGSFWLAVAILGMIFVHETGHLHAAKLCGCSTKGFYFLPGLGGVAIISPPSNRLEDCYISIAGPIYGLAYSLLFAILYGVSNIPQMGYIAFTCAIINLFNLLPIYPLDGGRIAKAIGYSLHRHVGSIITYGSIIFGVFMLFKGWYVFGFVAFMGLLEHIQMGHREITKDKMGFMKILFYSLVTASVIAALVACSFVTFNDSTKHAFSKKAKVENVD